MIPLRSLFDTGLVADMHVVCLVFVLLDGGEKHRIRMSFIILWSRLRKETKFLHSQLGTSCTFRSGKRQTSGLFVCVCVVGGGGGGACMCVFLGVPCLNECLKLTDESFFHREAVKFLFTAIYAGRHEYNRMFQLHCMLLVNVYICHIE